MRSCLRWNPGLVDLWYIPLTRRRCRVLIGVRQGGWRQEKVWRSGIGRRGSGGKPKPAVHNNEGQYVGKADAYLSLRLSSVL